MTRKPRLLVVCGLRREAACAEGEGVAAIVGSGRRRLLEERLGAVDSAGLEAVISFGLAAGLDPALGPGDVAIPETIRAGDSRATAELSIELRRAALMADIPVAACETLAAVDLPLATPAAKAALRARTGAGAADMESHVAANYAARNNLRFGVLRVISDGSGRVVPPAAIAAIGTCGGIDVPAVLGSVLRQPTQIPALIETAREGALAFRVLGRVGGLLLGLHLR